MTDFMTQPADGSISALHFPELSVDDAVTAWAPQVRVRGEATIEAAPEAAKFSVVIQDRAKGHWQTFEKVSQYSTDCLALISAYRPAVEDAESSRLWVSPELRSRGDKVRWYRAATRTRFTVTDFSVLSELVSRLYELDLAVVEGPWWQLRPGSPVYHEALAGAVRAAMTRATEYAEAIGGRLTALLELADPAVTGGGRGTTDAAEPAPWPGATALGPAAPARGSGPSGMSLEPVPQTVHASVAARFSMTPPASLGLPES